jgi:hypothetical protein
MAWLEIISKDMLRVNAVQLALNEEGNDRTAFYSLDTPATYEIKPSADNTAIEARATVILAEWQIEYDAQAYARNRKAEYDQLNQFEMQFDDKEDSTTTWVDKINEIKGRHPK